MGLYEEIERNRASVRSYGLSMALGELIELYRDGQLELIPEYQRLLRWDIDQKSALVESILLGIPIPPIYVAERSDGVWEVIDGLQRLSTVFELVGLGTNKEGKVVPPLVLRATKFLQSLEGKTWNGSDKTETGLSQRVKLMIKRSSWDVKVIKDDLGKYEVFLRLNTSGVPLTPQAVRNCVLAAENPDMLNCLKRLNEMDDFQNCLRLSETLLDEQFDMELVMRFVLLHSVDLGRVRKMTDLTTLLNDLALEKAQSDDFDLPAAEKAFTDTFTVLANTLEENAFRKFVPESDRWVGGFSTVAFEVIALGIGYGMRARSCPDGVGSTLEEKVKQFWTDDANKGIRVSAGKPASARLPKTIETGRVLFSC